MKHFFVWSITPVSTAATVATSDDGILTNSNDSDTYEPIEAFQDMFVKPKNTENAEQCDESKRQVTKSYGNIFLFIFSDFNFLSFCNFFM